MTHAFYFALGLCLAAMVIAGASVLLAFQRTNEERDALIQFVCAAVDIAEQQRTPEALARAERFEEILAVLGEACP